MGTLPTKLSEEFRFDSASDEFNVKADEYLIEGVVVLQEESRNGRRYTAQARQDAVPLYERRAVHIGHETGDQYERRNGALVNSRLDKAGSKVIADWSLNKGHALTEQILDDAQKRPFNLALSHEVPQGGFEAEFIQEGILQVNRIFEMDIVSVVTDGGTNRGLNEGLNKMDAERLAAIEEKAEKILESLKDANISKKTVKDSDAISALVDALRECACQESGVSGDESRIKELEEQLQELKSQNSELQEKLGEIEPKLQEYLDRDAAESAKAEVNEIMEELKVDAERVGEDLMERLLGMEEADRRLFLSPLSGSLEESDDSKDDSGKGLNEGFKPPKSKSGVSGKESEKEGDGTLMSVLFGAGSL